MNFEEINFGFETVRWLMMTAIGVYAWFVGRQSASGKELLELRTRIIQVETELQQLPRQAEVHEMALKVERLDVSVRGMGQHLNEMRASVRRIEDYLMDEARTRGVK